MLIQCLGKIDLLHLNKDPEFACDSKEMCEEKRESIFSLTVTKCPSISHNYLLIAEQKSESRGLGECSTGCQPIAGNIHSQNIGAIWRYFTGVYLFDVFLKIIYRSVQVFRATVLQYKKQMQYFSCHVRCYSLVHGIVDFMGPQKEILQKAPNSM